MMFLNSVAEFLSDLKEVVKAVASTLHNIFNFGEKLL